MKNLFNFPNVISVIAIVISIFTIAVNHRTSKNLKLLEQYRLEEQGRQYSETLPINVSIHVRISDGQEVKLGTVGKTEIAIKCYRHAILRWENAGVPYISVIHEKDLQTANPKWFETLVSADGRSITLNDQECSPPYQIHTWPTEMRN